MSATPPDNPAGPLELVEQYNDNLKTELINGIWEAPERLRTAVAGLCKSQLDTCYKNWTIRQIAHHIADSHLNSLIRFKWTLAEDNPTIKAYEEADWVELADCKYGDVSPALAMLDGLHAKWIQVLQSMSPDQFDRTFVHPQTGEAVSLWTALNYYAWHSRHHTEQINWLRKHHGWS